MTSDKYYKISAETLHSTIQCVADAVHVQHPHKIIAQLLTELRTLPEVAEEKPE